MKRRYVDLICDVVSNSLIPKSTLSCVQCDNESNKIHLDLYSNELEVGYLIGCPDCGFSNRYTNFTITDGYHSTMNVQECLVLWEEGIESCH